MNKIVCAYENDKYGRSFLEITAIKWTIKFWVIILNTHIGFHFQTRGLDNRVRLQLYNDLNKDPLHYFKVYPIFSFFYL